MSRYTPETYRKQKGYEAKYKAKLAEQGIKDHHIWVNAQQWEVIKAFTRCVRKIKRLDRIVGFDVSRDYLEYKIILDDSVLNGGVINEQEQTGGE